MSYDDYLQTAHWKRTRAAAIHRALGRCQLCNRATPLQVHHRTYERLGHEWPEDVIALCEEHHEMCSETQGPRVLPSESRTVRHDRLKRWGYPLLACA